MKRVLCFDIGGSKLLAGVVDEEGRVLDRRRASLPEKYDFDYLIDELCRLAEGFEKYSPELCGVTVPGLCDPASGVWVYAPFSGLSDLPIAARLGERFGLPVYIENDVNACALAEARFGACRGVDDFIWITVSNGVGGGVFLDGKLYCGHLMNAGEIGHIITDETSDNLCGCGNRGCLEAMASGASIAKIYYARTGVRKNAKEVADAAKAGDEIAREIYRAAGWNIGRAAADAANLMNLSCAVIGGGVSGDFALLEPSINAALERFLFKRANPNFRVIATALGYEAALIGCAATALR